MSLIFDILRYICIFQGCSIGTYACVLSNPEWYDKMYPILSQGRWQTGNAIVLLCDMCVIFIRQKSEIDVMPTVTLAIFYIFIIDLTHGFNVLGGGSRKTRRESFKFRDLVSLIFDILLDICIFQGCSIGTYACVLSNPEWYDKMYPILSQGRWQTGNAIVLLCDMCVIFIRQKSEIDVMPTVTLAIFYPDNYTGHIGRIIVSYPNTNIL